MSPFRTAAWTDAWLATYGQLPGVNIYDLGGRGNSLEMVYTKRRLLKEIVPIVELATVGCGSPALASPRSEYNNLPLDAGSLWQEIQSIPWQRCHLSDLDCCAAVGLVEHLADAGAVAKLEQQECYRVERGSFEHYLAALGKNTRSRYFAKRARLEREARVEWKRFDHAQINQFFELLNRFHIGRWGRPCYSAITQQMLIQFTRELEHSGGKAIFSVLDIEGKPHSVLFDVVWEGVRFNLQSGYQEHFNSQLKLGSLHLGKAIEEALTENLSYDCLAGGGLSSNYKERIANHKPNMVNIVVERGWLSDARRIRQRLFRS